MSTVFSVQMKEKNGISIIIPNGYIDAESQEGLEQVFEKVKASGNTKMLFNFSETKKINSTGMSLILYLLQESMNSGIKVHFSNLSRINQKLFSMIGIDEFGEMFHDEADALASFG
ncbi:STAS domain-containing protein [candidate division CSSED10-310 bacterium]|uniref:STAS domain-containing protein n=1 Tax=candidate division CSSED10-310 bacterium TaxID=2855610 RepID=A0ABV6YV50_UNCC1